MSRDLKAERGPARRDADRSRRVILDAAERLFAVGGFDRTSMQAVADAAGVARGTPGYFFGSKEGLYRAVLDRAIGARRELVERITTRALERDQAPLETIVDCVTAYFDTLSADPNFLPLVDRESLGERRIYDSEAQLESLRDGAALVATLLERAGCTMLDARQFLITALGLCEWSFAHHPLVAGLGFDPLGEEFLTARRQHIAAIVRGALASAS